MCQTSSTLCRKSLRTCKPPWTLKTARESTNGTSSSRSHSQSRRGSPRRSDRSKSRGRRPDCSQSSSSNPKKAPSSRQSLGGGTSSMSSHHTWANAHPEETPDYDAEIRFPDESERDDAGPLTEASKETHVQWSVLNEVRRRTRSKYKLPKAEATRTLPTPLHAHTSPADSKSCGRRMV